jgi:hypothetical protein
VLTTLVNDLGAVANDIVLVLDDYQTWYQRLCPWVAAPVSLGR